MQACRINNQSIGDDEDPKDQRKYMDHNNGNIDIIKSQFEIPEHRKKDFYKEFCVANWQGNPTGLIAF